jgi:hypothetical protein
MQVAIRRKAVGALVTVTLASASACSGSGNPSIFPPPSDAAPNVPPGPDASPFASVPPGDAAPASCSPANMSGFQATWAPPETFSTSCTAAQVTGYYEACLAEPTVAATCMQFQGANPGCSQCIASQDTDSQLGPVVWHLESTYYTINLAGCIARAMGNTSATGCGAAYGATTQCDEKACDACFSTSAPSFTKFSACEAQADETVCSSLQAAIPGACGDLSSGPAAQCFPPQGATAEQAFLVVAPIFCGGG